MSERSSRANGRPLTVAQLAEWKQLPAEFLRGSDVGLVDLPGGVGIPYFDRTGEELFVRRRLALKGKSRFFQPKGVPLRAYGQWRLDRAERAGFLLVVEGESNCWALWLHGLPALGLPGSNAAATLEAEHVEGVETVYIHRDPDQGGAAFLEAAPRRLKEIGFRGKAFDLRTPDGVKDPADLHAADPDQFKAALEACIRAATPIVIGGGAKREQAGRGDPAFANYRVEKVGDRGTVKVGLSAGRIAQRLGELTNGWPKRVDQQLFVRGDGCRPLWLEAADALFAWTGAQLQADVDNAVWWARGEDKVTQAQFHAHLRQTAERFDAIEAAPHYPSIPRTYYMHPEIKGGDGRALGQLLARFRPASEVDADLVKALFLSLFWGGPPGQRPAFLLECGPDDPQGGRGVGKSKLAQAAAHLVGGHIDARPDKDIDKLMTRLLSPAALDRRVVLLDNVKVLRFSWGDLEALITGDVVSGRALYVGEGRRPNTLIWFITLNNASLSRDMAQRCVPIRLRRPERNPAWETDTWDLIERLRWAIVGDALAELRRPCASLARFSRWAAWEHAVLSRVGDPAACQQAIEERQAAIDDDSAEADLVRAAFAEELRRRGHTPDLDAVWISAQAAAEVVNRATGEKQPVNRAGMYLKTLTIHELRKSDYHGSRGWAWRGKDSDPSATLQELCDVAADVFPR